MPTTRPIATGALAAALLFAGAVSAQQAAAYPTKPIRMIVPGAPGTLSDLVGRLVGERLGAALGQPVIVDNRPGAGGVVALQATKGQTDGHTLVYHFTGYTQGMAFRQVSPYTFADFIPVAQISSPVTGLFVPASLGVDSVKDLVARLKAAPGKYSFGSPGVGTTGHITLELLAKTAGLETTHIPYRGDAPAIVDLLGGQLGAFSGGSLAGFMPQVRAGQLKLLAVATETRTSLAPGAPTWVEAGYPAIALPSWTGVLVAAGTTPAVVRRLSDEITKIVRDPAVARKIEEYGAEPVARDSAEFSKFLAQDLERWRNTARITGIKFE